MLTEEVKRLWNDDATTNTAYCEFQKRVADTCIERFGYDPACLDESDYDDLVRSASDAAATGESIEHAIRLELVSLGAIDP